MSTDHPQTPEPTSSAISMARQAIVNDSGSIMGYELFDRSVKADAHTASSDAQMLFNLLSLAEGETLIGKTLLFVNCTHDSLAGGHLDLVAPEHVVLEIPSLPASQVEQIALRLPTLQAIHARGFKLAFDYSVLTRSYEDWLPLASYIKFDVSILKPPSLASFVQLAQDCRES
jgi:c-di-GMP-related signal transduction protein